MSNLTTYKTLATQTIISKGNTISIKLIESSLKWSETKPEHVKKYYSIEINGEHFGGYQVSKNEVNWYLEQYTDNKKLEI